jgi:hypothetical protein
VQRADELLKCSFSVALKALTEEVAEIEGAESYRSSLCWRYKFA